MIIVRVFIILLVFMYSVVLLRDVYSKWHQIGEEKGSWGLYGICEAVIYALGAYGVSDSALNTILFRNKNRVSMEKIPGTIIVGATMPMCMIALSYATMVEVRIGIVLLFMCAGGAGAFFGATIVSKCSPGAIRKLLILALSLSLLLVLMKMTVFSQTEASINTLTPLTLGILTGIVFIIMAMSMVGLSSATPMAMIFMLFGLDSVTALAMTTAIASVSTPVGSMKYIRQGKYNQKPVLVMYVIGSIAGVIATRFTALIPAIVIQVIMLGAIVLAVGMLVIDKGESQTAQKPAIITR